MQLLTSTPLLPPGKKTRSWRGVALVSTLLLALLCSILLRANLAEGMVQVGDLFFGGSSYYDLGVADTFYLLALSIDQKNPHAWHQRARIDFLKGDFDGALSKIERQIALHGESVMPSFYIRGLIYGYRKEFPKAQEDFKRFLIWDPGNWAARNDLAWVYFADGEFKNTLEAAEVGLRFNPGNPWLLTMKGMSLFNRGDSVSALQYLEAAHSAASVLSEEQWSRAYPGNDPRIAGAGLFAMRKAIEEDISLVHKSLAGESAPAIMRQ